MNARDAILARALTAVRDIAEPPPVPRKYRAAGTQRLSPAAAGARLAQRLREYGANVSFTTPDNVECDLGRIARSHRVRTAVSTLEVSIPGVRVIRDSGLSPHELNELDAALTGCALAVAETGTLVLDGCRTSGRRVVSLIPDLHLCVVRVHQIVPDVPDAVAAIVQGGLTNSALTFISGPSATSDIGFERVEGVHGPRALEVLILGAADCDRAAFRRCGLS